MTPIRRHTGNQRGATLIEYSLLVGILAIFVISGMAYMSDGFAGFFGKVEEQNQLADGSNQYQTFIEQENLVADYSLWVTSNDKNYNDAWSEYVEINKEAEYGVWIESKSGWTVAPTSLITDLSSSQTGGEVTLLWTPEPATEGQTVRGYNIYVDSIKVGSAPPVAVSSGNTQIGYTLVELNSNTTYSFTVQPYNKFGRGAHSNSTTLTTTDAAALTPSEPLNVVTVAQSGEVRVMWTAPASDGGSTIESYFIEAGPESFIDGVKNMTALPTDTVLHNGVTKMYVDFTGLTNGKTFTFSIKAYNGSYYGEAATTSNAPYEPFDISALADGIEPHLTMTTGLTSSARYSPEAAIPATTINFNADEIQLYRVMYQELWRKDTAQTNEYVLRLRLGDGTLLREQVGVLDGASASKDNYISMDALVVIPAGEQTVYLTLENLESSGNLQGYRNASSPTVFSIQDVSYGEVTEIGSTGQQLSALPYGVEDYVFEGNSGGIQTLTTASSKITLPGSGVTVTPSVGTSYRVFYSGKWRSLNNATDSNMLFYLYVDGVETAVIAQESLGNEFETITGNVLIPTLAAGSHTITIKAQTLYDTSEYVNTTNQPQIVYAENVNGSNPMVIETQVDVSEIAHGLKAQTKVTTPVAATIYGSSSLLLPSNTLTFSNNVPGTNRVYLIGISIPVTNSAANDSLVVQANTGSGTPIRMIQTFFTQAGATETYQGFFLMEVPSGNSISTIQFSLKAPDGGTVTIPASSADPIVTYAIDLGDS